VVRADWKVVRLAGRKDEYLADKMAESWTVKRVLGTVDKMVENLVWNLVEYWVLMNAVLMDSK